VSDIEQPGTTEAPISMRQLLEAGVHFGHQTKRWNPKMRPFIFGARNGIHIIDLQHTVKLFRRAYDFIVDTAARGDSVLFVGTKKQAQDVIAEEAGRSGQHYVTNRWLGGTLTNFRTVKGSLDRMRSIEKMAEDGTFERISKKEILGLQREHDKLEKSLGGLKNMTKLPGAVFIVDPHKEHIAISEARKLEIPVVAVTDTNCDPDLVDYVIPGNDDAIRAIKLFAAKVADAAILGSRLQRERSPRRGEQQEVEKEQVIHVQSGGDGPKVEVAQRGRRAPAPDASATPESGANAGTGGTSTGE
jgi:small subunit ribosomal protein S2